MITGRRLNGSCPPVGLEVESEAAMGLVRNLAAAAAHAQGFDRMHAKRVALVATAMATNLLKRTRSGRMLVQLMESGDLRGVELVATSGPGMDETDHWKANGGSTGDEGDAGLAAIAHHSDLFDVYSVVGRGTVMMARLWGSEPATAADTRFRVGSMTEAIAGEVVSGDAWAVEQQGARVVALVADGLGHGPEAAAASAGAVRAFRQHHLRSVEDIASHIHGALHATRGAAIAVAEVDSDFGRVRFCGIGNIAARLIVAGGDHQLVSLYGIAGYQTATIRAFEGTWENGALLVIHTDGLSPKWDLGDYPDLHRHHPQLAAATVMRDAPRAADDALVLALSNADEVVPSMEPEEE